MYAEVSLLVGDFYSSLYLPNLLHLYYHRLLGLRLHHWPIRHLLHHVIDCCGDGPVRISS